MTPFSLDTPFKLFHRHRYFMRNGDVKMFVFEFHLVFEVIAYHSSPICSFLFPNRVGSQFSGGCMIQPRFSLIHALVQVTSLQ